MGLVRVVQLVDQRLRRIPVVQAVVCLLSFGEGVRQHQCQDTRAAAEHRLLDLGLEGVGAVVPLLNQVVGDALENRIGPEQIEGADRWAATSSKVARRCWSQHTTSITRSKDRKDQGGDCQLGDLRPGASSQQYVLLWALGNVSQRVDDDRPVLQAWFGSRVRDLFQNCEAVPYGGQ